MLDVDLAYVDARSGTPGHDRLSVPQPEAAAPEGLRAAMALVDQYDALAQALDTYHVGGDEKAAFALLDGLTGRIEQLGLPGFEGEAELVGGLRDRAAWMAGYSGEMPKELQPLALIGEWTVRYRKGVSDLAFGDTVELTEDGEFLTYPRNDGDEISQRFEVNERQIRLHDTEYDKPPMVFAYQLNGDRLSMRTRDGAMISLVRD